MKALKYIALTSIAVGISWYIWYQVQLSQKLNFGYANIKFLGYKNNQLNIGMDLSIKNTSDLDVNIRGVDIDIYSNGVFITRVFTDIEVMIQPNKTTELPIVLLFNPKLIFKDLGQIVFGQDVLMNMEISMKGTIKVRKSGIPLPIPFKYTSRLSDWI